MTENNKPRTHIKVEEGARPSSGLVMVYATYPSLCAAEEAGRRLVEGAVAGCVNILPAMVSLYVWQGALERSEEVVLLAKTTAERCEVCMHAILASHPYATPAVLALPVVASAADYFDWISAGTRQSAVE